MILILALLLQSPLLDEIVADWAREDLASREAATARLLDRWKDWGEGELGRLRFLAKGRDEVASRAASGLERIEARRRLSPKLLEAIPGIDTAVSPGERVALLPQVRTALDKGLLHEFDLEPLEVLLATTDWKDQAGPFLDELTRFPDGLLAAAAIKLVEHPEARVRRNAAIHLTWLPDSDRRIEVGLRLLDHPELPMKASGLELLRCPRARPQAPKLLGFLTVGNADLRHQALLTLGLMGASQFAGKIAKALDDPDAWVRVGALWALKALGSAEQREAILPLLADRAPEVRANALETLGRAEDARPLLQDPDVDVRCAAAKVLMATGSADDARLLSPLLEDANRGVREAAIRALGRLDPAAQAPATLKHLATLGGLARVQFLWIVAESMASWPAPARADLVKFLEDLEKQSPEPKERRAATGLLIRLGRKTREERLAFLDAFRPDPPDASAAWFQQHDLDALGSPGPLAVPAVLASDEDLRRALAPVRLDTDAPVLRTPRPTWNLRGKPGWAVLRTLLPPGRTYLDLGDSIRILTWADAIPARKKQLAAK